MTVIGDTISRTNPSSAIPLFRGRRSAIGHLEGVYGAIDCDIVKQTFGMIAKGSGKKKAHKLKKIPWDTGRVSLEHPAGQTGLYRAVSQRLPVVHKRKTDIFARTPAGCPRDTWPSRGFSGVLSDFLSCAFSAAKIYFAMCGVGVWASKSLSQRDLIRIVIFFSLTEAPLTDPTTTPPNTPETGPETDPEQTRNGAERSQTEPKWTEIKPSRVGRPGVCRDGEGWGL